MSAADKTGGPAFPVDFDHHTFAPRNVEEAKRLMSGMTLRDYFAAKAMQALLSQLGPHEDDPTGNNAFPCGRGDVPNVDECAAYAYSQADAMLAARQGGAA